MQQDALNEKLHPPLMLLIALVQGLLLLLLHQAIEREFWPHQSPRWLFCFYAMSFAGPTLLLLSIERANVAGLLRWLLPFTVLVGLLGYYVGSQATPLAHVDYEPLLFAFVLTLALACFKAVMYAQSSVNHGNWHYPQLFRYSWRNFLTLALGGLFACSFWAVMMLWAALFKAINIDFFYELFTESWFYYPALSLANGVGILLFRHLSQVVDTITRLQQALMKLLLVLLAGISLLFLAALPFSGLAPLWESGGSALILWLQALMLFFVNAVYQADAECRPYSRWVHRLIAVSVALLPVYSAISFYGLCLRIDQYGLSLSRLWALLIWLLLMLCSVGYLVGLVRLRDAWLGFVAWVNVRLGLLLLALMLLVNSPLLDFRKLTVASQLDRLAQGAIAPEDFDVHYFRQHLARPGYEALQTLQAQTGQPALALRIEALYSDRNPEPVVDRARIAAAFESEQALPTALVDRMVQDLQARTWALSHNRAYLVLSADLDRDGQTEYLLATEREHDTQLDAYVWEDNGWQRYGLSQRGNGANIRAGGEARDGQDLLEQLRRGDFQLTPPRWQRIVLGDQVFQVDEARE